MKSLAILAFSLAASAGMALAQPSFDCAKAQSEAETLICADAALAALDVSLSEHFQAALAAAQGLDANGQDVAETLKATQRGWIKGRDECWKAADLRDCVEFAYRRRDAELVTQWMLQEPVSTVFWSCDGNPANEVVTMFFDTDLPCIRFEHGDEGSFGRSIWMKGDSATYRSPDPDGREYACVIRR